MKDWLGAHKASFKALLVWWPTLVAFWAFSESFRVYVLHLYSLLPAGVHEFAAAVLVPAIAFWRVRKTAQEQAEAKAKSGAALLGFALFALVMAMPSRVEAQAVPLKTLYAGGVSYSSGGDPSIAVTLLGATQMSSDTAPGTYAFTAIDILPSSGKPLTVSTNVAGGVAQKLFTVGDYSLYVPLAAGFTVTGSNAGWNWSTGGCTDVPLKNGFGLMPCVRVLKGSVGGNGYQLLPSVLLRWGK